jgi:hypothetical protein
MTSFRNKQPPNILKYSLSFLHPITMNTHDLLIQCCSQSSSYPCNLLKPCQRRTALVSASELLIKMEKRLFEPSKEEIVILEPKEGTYGKPYDRP